MKIGAIFFGIILIALSISCTSSKKINRNKPLGSGSLRFVNEYVVPHAKQFNGTTIGGLSGIDYDPVDSLYYLITDDRSDRNPARFYTAKIHIREWGIDSVEFLNAVSLIGKDGRPYPNRRTDSLHTTDPESIRINPETNELVWSSEGERVIAKNPILIDPGIYIADKSGKYKTEFEIPDNLRMRLDEKGPRLNGVFEGISFSDDYQYLYASLEEPRYEDGRRAGSKDSTAWVRFIKFDLTNKKAVAQYAYQIDPIPYVANPPGAFRINGVSESYFIGNEQFLVIERSFATGHNGNGVRIYLADARDASDISSIQSLEVTPAAKPISKKLLLNMDDLGRYIDNIEGITFGPILPNGHRSLILVADDNFDQREKTQFFLFEYLP